MFLEWTAKVSADNLGSYSARQLKRQEIRFIQHLQTLVQYELVNPSRYIYIYIYIYTECFYVHKERRPFQQRNDYGKIYVSNAS